MKPCSKNRNLIAWLAVDELPDPRARELRAHLEACPGCRGYLDEISTVAKSLAAAEIPSEIQTSASFHHRVVRALAAEAARSPWQTLAAWLGTRRGPRAVLGSQQPRIRKDAQIYSAMPLQLDALRATDGSRSVPFGRSLAMALTRYAHWRLALPVIVGGVIVVVALSGLRRHTGVLPPSQPVTRVVPAPGRTGDLPPTLSNYQMAADRSPEALDELLTAQARKNPVSAPVYTASTRLVFNASD